MLDAGTTPSVGPVPSRGGGRRCNIWRLYLTEDEHDGLLYRFVPEVKGDLSAGKLQALAIQKAPRSDLRNWDQDSPGPSPVTGDTLPVEWVDLLDIHAPRGDLRIRGHEIHGAARFARGEGIWAGNGSVYVACTNGGRSRNWSDLALPPQPPLRAPIRKPPPPANLNSSWSHPTNSRFTTRTIWWSRRGAMSLSVKMVKATTG